jgi:hypothetical protein
MACEPRDAKVLRRRLKNVPVVDLLHARSAAWLAANIDNPFAAWKDVDATLGRKAAALWRAALGDARQAGASPTIEKAKTIVATFIAGFNEFHRDIDTSMREEVCDAAHLLVNDHLGAVMSEEATTALIDEWREF